MEIKKENCHQLNEILVEIKNFRFVEEILRIQPNTTI